MWLPSAAVPVRLSIIRQESLAEDLNGYRETFRPLERLVDHTGKSFEGQWRITSRSIWRQIEDYYAEDMMIWLPVLSIGQEWGREVGPKLWLSRPRLTNFRFQRCQELPLLVAIHRLPESCRAAGVSVQFGSKSSDEGPVSAESTYLKNASFLGEQFLSTTCVAASAAF